MFIRIQGFKRCYGLFVYFSFGLIFFLKLCPNAKSYFFFPLSCWTDAMLRYKHKHLISVLNPSNCSRRHTCWANEAKTLELGILMKIIIAYRPACFNLLNKEHNFIPHFHHRLLLYIITTIMNTFKREITYRLKSKEIINYIPSSSKFHLLKLYINFKKRFFLLT